MAMNQGPLSALPAHEKDGYGIGAVYEILRVIIDIKPAVMSYFLVGNRTMRENLPESVTTVEWGFAERKDDATFVSITNSKFSGEGKGSYKANRRVHRSPFGEAIGSGQDCADPFLALFCGDFFGKTNPHQ